MPDRSSQPLIPEERTRLEGGRLRSLIGRIGEKGKVPASHGERLVDCCRISVSQCFMPADFKEEMPLYLLDLGDGTILILFGQWMYDPNTLSAPEKVFATWDEQSFFRGFSLRCLQPEGTVFSLEGESTDFVAAQRFPAALKFKWLR